jgi:hypothetical protein
VSGNYTLNLLMITGTEVILFNFFLFISVPTDTKNINMHRVITVTDVKIDLKETGSKTIEGRTQSIVMTHT